MKLVSAAELSPTSQQPRRLSATPWYPKTSEINRATHELTQLQMEHVVPKTVSRFLNAEGGPLLIGVGDDGGVLGLADDMKTLGAKANVWGFHLI